MKLILQNRSGQTLVGVLVAAAVGAVVMGFITDIMVQQGIGQKFLTQKIEINDLANNVLSTFIKPNLCTCQFANDSTTNPNFANWNTYLKFDSTDTSGAQKISIKKLYSGCLGGANPPLLMAEDGQPLPRSTSNLIVDKVEFTNLVPTGSPNEWMGTWEISFTYGTGSNSAIRSVKPVSISQKVTVDGASANARIVQCNEMSAGTGTPNFLSKWGGTPGVLQDSVIFESGGNVGIGETSPAGKLHLRKTGGAQNTIGLYIQNNHSGVGQYGSAIYADHTSNSNNQYNSAGMFQTSYSGTGSSEVTAVSGTMRSSAVTTSLDMAGARFSAIISSGGAAAVSGVMSSADVMANTTDAYGIKSWVTNYLGAVTIGNAYGVHSKINSSGTITNAYGVYVDTLAGTNKWSLFAPDANSPSYFAGRVGVGTSAPSTDLEVRKAVPVLQVKGTDSNNLSVLRVENNNVVPHHLNVVMGGTAMSGNIFGMSRADTGQIFTNTQPLGIGTLGNQNLIFGTNDSARMTISNTGEIGVGTTPAGTYKFQVNGGISLFSNVIGQSGITITKADGGPAISANSSGGYHGISVSADSGSAVHAVSNSDALFARTNGAFGIAANLMGVSATSLALKTNGNAGFWSISGHELAKIVTPTNLAFATFNAASAVMYVAKDSVTNRSISANGTVNANGADFAERISWTGEKPVMGSVILYKGSYVVVSSEANAAFVGNDIVDPVHSILIAFAGQLPVRVRGVVNEGDLIVANDDGTAKAVPKFLSTVVDAYRAVGTAWESSSNEGLKRINVAVGIGLAGGAHDIASLKSENEILKAKVSKFEQENAAIKSYLCGKDPQASICH